MLRSRLTVLVFFIFCISTCYAQDGTKFYRVIELPEVTDNAEIISMLQDSNGYMWFGTTEGLFRFDGSEFKRYQNEYGNEKSIIGDIIYALEEDALGNIWLGTKSGGISVLDPVLDTLAHHRYDPNDTIPFANYYIAEVRQDSDSNVWVGSLGGGLGNYNASENTINYYQKDDDGNSISQNYVTKIMEDREGQLWIGLNGGGINKFNPETGLFQHYRFDILQDATSNFRNNVVRDMYDDGNGNIWLATYGGFNKFSKATGTFTHYDMFNEPILKSNSLNSINLIGGKLYITSYDGYWYAFDLDGERFLFSEQIEGRIRTAYTNGDGLYWLGLTSGQVMVMSQNEDFPFYRLAGTLDQATSIVKVKGDFIGSTAFSGIYSNPGNNILLQEALSDQSVLCMEKTPEGNIWIGTNSGGVNIYEPSTGHIEVLRHGPKNGKSLPHDTVLDIFADEYGDIWVGTLSGLGQWIPSTQSFLKWGSVQFKDIIRPDKKELWAATDIGVAIIDPTTKSFRMEQADVEQKRDGLLHNQVNALYTPDNDSILIGSERGLNIFIRSRDKMINAHETLGLPYGKISDIAQDHHKNYWMVTAKGVLQVDIKNKIWKLYDKTSGLNINTGYSSFIRFDQETKTILISAVGGYYGFNPPPIRINQNPIPLLITEVRLFNQPISDTAVLTSIKNGQHIELPHNEDMVSISFAGLDYMNASKLSYAYRLQGYNEDWIQTKDRVASFTNLEPGDYLFEAKSTNADGVWSDAPTSMTIRINPPFWATWWAYGLYALLALVILYALIRNFVMRERLKARLQMEHLEVEKLKEFSAMKSRFFANISHEFRTPLTLITGPVDDLLEKSGNPSTKESLGIIKRNGERLKQLIDQILDFSRLEAKKVKVKKERSDLYGLLRASAASFVSLAERHRITYLIDIPLDSLWALVDSEKIEIVLNNLISNALKFTPESGRVIVRAGVESNDIAHKLVLSVEDNGPGLSIHEKEQVFERFYRVEKRDDAGGTGIGLALTKEIVDLMEGSIRVLGEEGKGCLFEVILPLELVERPETITGSNVEVEIDNQSNLKEAEVRSKSILLVEDNKDLRMHFRNLFGEQWQIFEATDGEMGLAMAVEKVPDLIVSDLMMPKMDGNELCKAVKQDERTAHIPFIMLTAKATERDKVYGLQHGANDYITKPFNKEELFHKIQNLLAQRNQMQEKLRKDLMIYPAQSADILSEKERFIIKLRKYIVDHLDDTEMNVNSLSREMGYSRIQLYRKVLGLTGLSTSDFIRQIRIHKAAELLQKRWGNVSEIAYAVGFNNLSYFTKSFKEVYKRTPSQFAKSKIELPQ